MLSYVRSDSVVSRVIAGETLIVPIRKGVGDLASIYGLNSVASAIWQLIEKPCTEAQIVERIESDFAADSGQIRQDVSAFLSDMSSAGLVRAAEVPA